MLLATDLDGTFLGGDDAGKKELYGLMKQPGIMLVFVTGRGLQSVMSLFDEASLLPAPHYIICDVGATVVHGKSLQPVEPLQSVIESKWPGNEKVLQHFNAVKGLTLQPVPQHRRCAFFYEEDVTNLEEVYKISEALGCDAIASAGKYVDILPGGVNKGTTLVQLIQLLQIEPGRILVAGDTMNDLAMYETGYNAVVVGNAEEKLLYATREASHIYHASCDGCGGILQALRHFPGSREYFNNGS